MKKMISIAAMMVFGLTISFAQTPTSSSSNASSDVEVTTPAVKVVEVDENAKKCAPVAGKSCCSHGSKTAAITTSTTATETEADAAATTTDKKCEEVSVGMSAAKPQDTGVAEPEK